MAKLGQVNTGIPPLLRALKAINHVAREVDSADPTLTDDWVPLPEIVERHRSQSEIEEILSEIERLLSDRGSLPAGDGAGSYGRSYVRTPARKIVRGYLEPVHVVPIVASAPPRALAFLTTIDGLKAQVDFERHGPVGWHYHYCDRNGRRSDTILSWDIHFEREKQHRPLFWEFHSDSEPKFYARPDQWGNVKRESVYATCCSDLNREILEFRHPSDNASPVWPIGATLTQNPLRLKPQRENGRKKRRR